MGGILNLAVKRWKGILSSLRMFTFARLYYAVNENDVFLLAGARERTLGVGPFVEFHVFLETL